MALQKEHHVSCTEMAYGVSIVLDVLRKENSNDKEQTCQDIITNRNELNANQDLAIDKKFTDDVRQPQTGVQLRKKAHSDLEISFELNNSNFTTKVIGVQNLLSNKHCSIEVPTHKKILPPKDTLHIEGPAFTVSSTIDLIRQHSSKYGTYQTKKGTEKNQFYEEKDLTALSGNIVKASVSKPLVCKSSEDFIILPGNSNFERKEEIFYSKDEAAPYQKLKIPRTTVNTSKSPGNSEDLSEDEMSYIPVNNKQNPNKYSRTELKRVSQILKYDMAKLKELHKNRAQCNIVLVVDEREEFDFDFKGFEERVNVLKIPGITLQNAFNFIRTHPSFGKGTIYILVCGIHDLVISSALSDCLFHRCSSPQTVFSLSNDMRDTCLISKAMALHFDILNSTPNDTALFCGLIPVDILPYNIYICTRRPCYTAHPTFNLPKLDTISFQRFIATIEYYNEFTKYHAQNLGFTAWDLEGPYFGPSVCPSRIERCFLSDKLSSDKFLLLPEENLARANVAKLLCQRLLSVFPNKVSVNQSLPMTCLRDLESKEGNAVVDNLLKSRPFNQKQRPKKYSENQLFKFDPILAFDILVMKEMICCRNLKNIVLVTDERDELDDKLQGCDERLKILRVPGVNLKNGFDKIQKHPSFGKGTIFIFSCGIHDILNSMKLEECVRHGCPYPQSVFSLPSHATDNLFLIKAAMALSFKILQSSTNDIALFCGLIPVDIGKYNMHTCMNRPCLTMHPALNLPVLDSAIYKNFLTTIQEYNNFTKRYAQSLGFTPWDVERLFFDQHANFLFQKMDLNGFVIPPEESISRTSVVKLLCQDLLFSIPKKIINPKVILQKYSDSQLENVRYLYHNQLQEIVQLQRGRTQSKIVIVTDERDDLDPKFVGFDQRVGILKIPGLKFATAFDFIKNHHTFKKGTMYIFSCGTYDLLQSVPLQECLNFNCPSPQIILNLQSTNSDTHYLIQKALQLHKNILNSSDNDIVLFCGLLPAVLDAFNKFSIATRACLPNHFPGLIPVVDPILNCCYEYAINWYNNFTKYHAQILEFEPWDLEIPHFSKTRQVLHANGFHLCENEEIERAKEAKALCIRLLPKLSSVVETTITAVKETEKNTLVHSDLSPVIKTEKGVEIMKNSPVEKDVLLTKTLQRSTTIGTDLKVSLAAKLLESSISDVKLTLPVTKSPTKMAVGYEVTAVEDNQIDSLLDVASFGFKEFSTYDQVVVIADKRYALQLQFLNSNKILILANEQLEMDRLQEYLALNTKKFNTKKTLYLIVIGIYNVTMLVPANVCKSFSCISPLESIVPLTDANFLLVVKDIIEGLGAILSHIKGCLNSDSSMAILPPLPITLISTYISHVKLHAGISQFPDFTIANCGVTIQKLYSVWMDNATPFALTSLVQCSCLHPSLLSVLKDEFKKLSFVEKFKVSKPNYDIWKNFVINIVNIALKENETWTDPVSTVRLFKDAYFDHVVFIGSASSFKLLPDVNDNAYTISYWYIDDISKSKNIFSKINELNKLSLQNVFFCFVSDISMIGIEDKFFQCSLLKCEHQLPFITLHSNPSNILESKLYKLLSSIKIIISEIKMLGKFKSKFILAPFIPRIYILVSDTNELKIHKEMHTFFEGKPYSCFLQGNSSSNWADSLLSFSRKWSLLSNQIINEDGEDLKGFSNIIHSRISRLTYVTPITWRILSQESLSEDFRAFPEWQSCMLSIVKDIIAVNEVTEQMPTLSEIPSQNILHSKSQAMQQSLVSKISHQNNHMHQTSILCGQNKIPLINQTTVKCEESKEHPIKQTKMQHNQNQALLTLNYEQKIANKMNIVSESKDLSLDAGLLFSSVDAGRNKIATIMTVKKGTSETKNVSLDNAAHNAGKHKIEMVFPTIKLEKTDDMEMAPLTKNDNVLVPSVDLQLNKNIKEEFHEEYLPILPIISQRIQPPISKHSFQSLHLLPIVCEDTDQREYSYTQNLKENSSSWSSTPKKRISTTSPTDLISHSDSRHVIKNSRSRSGTPKLKNTTSLHPDFTSCSGSPSAIKKPRSRSITPRKRTPTPDFYCIYRKSLSRSQSPKVRTPVLIRTHISRSSSYGRDRESRSRSRSQKKRSVASLHAPIASHSDSYCRSRESRSRSRSPKKMSPASIHPDKDTHSQSTKYKSQCVASKEKTPTSMHMDIKSNSYSRRESKKFRSFSPKKMILTCASDSVKSLNSQSESLKSRTRSISPKKLIPTSVHVGRTNHSDSQSKDSKSHQRPGPSMKKTSILMQSDLDTIYSQNEILKLEYNYKKRVLTPEHARGKSSCESKESKGKKHMRQSSCNLRKRSRSRSTSHHKKSKGHKKSTSHHKKSKGHKKSKSHHKKSKHIKSISKSIPLDSMNSEGQLLHNPPSEITAKETDFLSLDIQAALRTRIGDQLFEEYTKALAALKHSFEKESEVYRNYPENHPNYSKYYKAFTEMYVVEGDGDDKHAKKLWVLFWNSKYDAIKSEDWTERQLRLIKEFDRRVDGSSTSSTLSLQPNTSPETSYSFSNALILLDKLCEKASFMSPAISEMKKICRDRGPKEAYSVVNDSENVMLINLVLEKFRTLCRSAVEDGRYLYKIAVDWIPKLLEEAKKVHQIKVGEIAIDINAIARVSVGQGDGFTRDLIRTALEYEGLRNPPAEVVTDLFRKVAAIHLT